ncbi:MAG: hypothetical protein JW814_06820 [Candidatus Krumholzibacteriota bacterium]|nr:hypothetical protein [Candidatus Krumholzibacteriota bacterium]
MHVAKAGWLLLIAMIIALMPSEATADPCLVVYPGGPCIYHFDPSEYSLAGPEDSCYDAEYDRGGYVLVEIGSCDIDESIYQAPGLEGFEVSTDGNDGYVFVGTDFDLIVDGFSNKQTTFVNILVVFDKFVPETCYPTILVDGTVLTESFFPTGDLVVSTPTETGNNYSDTMTFDISWFGCYGLHIWAFSDENYNGVRDGGECFTAFSHDMVVPVDKTSWGRIKTIGSDEKE